MVHRTRAAVVVQANSFAVPDTTVELKPVKINLVNLMRVNFQLYPILIDGVIMLRILISRNAQLSGLIINRREPSRLN